MLMLAIVFAKTQGGLQRRLPGLLTLMGAWLLALQKGEPGCVSQAVQCSTCALKLYTVACTFTTHHGQSGGCQAGACA